MDCLQQVVISFLLIPMLIAYFEMQSLYSRKLHWSLVCVWLFECFFILSCSVIEYETSNLEMPTILVVGSLIKSGIPVLVYRWSSWLNMLYNFIWLYWLCKTPKINRTELINVLFVSSGDQDSVIPLIGSRTNVNNLATKLGLNTTVPYRVWFEGKQVICKIYHESSFERKKLLIEYFLLSCSLGYSFNFKVKRRMIFSHWSDLLTLCPH